ncbi:MAG: metalloregulator ArsR/SmtB family transcription factor [Pseudomonadota bacterium]
MPTDSNALQCLGDPTRRAIIDRLRAAPASVGEVARTLPVSRPAVSQHLKVLEAAGLVQQERRGTQRIFRLDVAGLADIRRYLDALWDDALAALAQDAESEERS